MQPFEVRWGEAEVQGILDQVRAYPWPRAPVVPDGWTMGCDAGYLRELCRYWTDEYDWRAGAAALNRLPQFTQNVDGLDLHFQHLIGEAGGRRPLLLLHGWPGSHHEFHAVAERLAFPSRFGGDPQDAFDLVIPSLPGFGFSGKPAHPIGPRTSARLFDKLMCEVLGYDRYLVHGGDFGAMTASWMGLADPERVRALHLTMVSFRPPASKRSPEEAAWADQQRRTMRSMGAYYNLQTFRPQSLGWMAAGNPVGEAAWIVERFHDWGDLRERTMDEVFPKDWLLTHVMIYVMSGSFPTAAWFYRGMEDEGGAMLRAGELCQSPTTFANFRGEAIYTAPPRSWAERTYRIARWTDYPKGGHFAAVEEPEALISDLQAWGRETG